MREASMRVENPQDVSVTLSLTMSVDDWEIMLDQLDAKWPSWSLKSVIRRAVKKVRQEFAESAVPFDA